MFLSEKEVQKLTRRKQPAAQCRVLRESGIAYRLVDGRPVVNKSEFEPSTLPPEPKLRLVRA